MALCSSLKSVLLSRIRSSKRTRILRYFFLGNVSNAWVVGEQVEWNAPPRADGRRLHRRVHGLLVSGARRSGVVARVDGDVIVGGHIDSRRERCLGDGVSDGLDASQVELHVVSRLAAPALLAAGPGPDPCRLGVPISLSPKGASTTSRPSALRPRL